MPFLSRKKGDLAMIRRANEQDITPLEQLYRKRVAYNDAHGIHQWEVRDILWETLSQTYQIEDFHVIEAEGRLIAAACFVDDDPFYWPMMKPGQSYYLHKLCVDPDYAKQGYSTQLIEYFKQAGKAKGYPDVRLDVRAHKQKLRAMYEAHGFVHLMTRKLFDEYETALYCYAWPKEKIKA